MTASSPPVPRTLYLPPPGRPRWVCPKSMKLDLQYLGWGKRRFAHSPIPVSLHHGWVYILVLKGAPVLQLVSKTFRTRPGQVLIIGPDCATGWTAESKDIAEMLIWVWDGASQCAGLTPKSNGFQAFAADRALIHALRQNHALCRREVEMADAHTAVVLKALRARCDVALARSLKPAAAAPEPTMRLEFALRWLAQNIAERRPVAGLSEYLQVSPVTLNRLFRAHLNESVASYYTRIRMERARQLMQTGATIKKTAYTFGYRHPNDFSRAFKKFTGRSPSK
ncbi:AraC family transcriptional regulator [bacterium]|nr:AraC family transcriptional regulator [bacterium]